MDSYAAEFLATLSSAQNAATALVLTAFACLGLRPLGLIALERKTAGAWLVAGRVTVALLFLPLAALYALFTRPTLTWDAAAFGAAAVTAALILARLAWRAVLRRAPSSRPAATGRGMRPARPAAPRRASLVPVLVQVIVLLSLLLLATLTLMRAGFLALTEDRPVLIVDVTGETAMQRVRWAPPDQPLRDEELLAHHVVFRTPDGETVGDAWMYGDEVGVKGRVLRLSPLLNAAGVPNLFELTFAHNGYATAERHAEFPHTAKPLPPVGPLSVHPWWRPLQRRLLERWEGAEAGSLWAVRSSTIESTFFSLADAQGRPVKAIYRVVLTPGGLTSS